MEAFFESLMTGRLHVAKILQLIFIVSCIFCLHANDTEWHWAVSAGGEASDISHCITMDNEGNVYLTGYVRDTVSFGEFVLDVNGSADVYVAKVNTHGEWVWVKNAGGADNDISTGMAITSDIKGNIYVTGYFRGTAVFGEFKLESLLAYDIFIAKINNDGEWQWAIRAGGGSTHESGTGIALDADKNIYLTGHFNGDAFFGDIELESEGPYDIFIAKLSNGGEWLWANRAGGFGEIKSNGIGIDSQGNCYLTGHFYDIVSFDEIELHSQGEYDSYVAKANRSGEWQWAVRAGGNQGCESRAIAVDSQGNSYLTGYFHGRALFGNIHLRSTDNYDAFVAKINREGEWQWAKKAGGTEVSSGRSIAIDEQGNCYVSGYFWGSIRFGLRRITSVGSYDVFAAKLNSAGEWLWVNRGGGTLSDSSYGIAVDGEGNNYISGFFTQAASFGDSQIQGNGNIDIFVAKLSEYSLFPNIAANPDPAHNYAGVPAEIDSLRWQYIVDDYYALPSGFKVYFSSSIVFDEEHNYNWIEYIEGETNYATPKLHNGYLDYSSQYFWKVVPTTMTRQSRQHCPMNNRMDSKAALRNEAHNVPVWTFRTINDYPIPAQNPNPANNSTEVNVNLGYLRWDYIEDHRFMNPEGFRVYLQDNDDFSETDEYEWVDFIDGQITYSTSSLPSETLAHSNRYFWKVVPTTKTPQKKVSGDVTACYSIFNDAYYTEIWSFKTEVVSLVDNYDDYRLKTQLSANYPNPFNPDTNIAFYLSENGKISLKVYNVRGQLVKTLLDEVHLDRGRHNIIWNGKDDSGLSAGSGVYFYKLTGETESLVRRMVLVK